MKLPRPQHRPDACRADDPTSLRAPLKRRPYLAMTICVTLAGIGLSGCASFPGSDSQPPVPSGYSDWFDDGWEVQMNRLDWGRIKRAREAIAAEDYDTAISSLKAMMDLDFPPAYYEMAKLYHYGRGVDQDYLQAEKYYGKALEVPSSVLDNASLNLAKLYLDPQVPRLAADDQRDVLAYHLLLQAMDEGKEDEGKVLFARLLSTGGENVKTNPELAEKLYLQAARNDRPEALRDLALAHLPGGWLKEDPILARDFTARYAAVLEQNATMGDVNAMLELARQHDADGLFGHEPDTQLMWLANASETGDRSARRQAGRAFLDTNTPDLGASLLEKAAEDGDIDAMAILGSAYLGYQGLEANPARAEQLLGKASKQGSVNATVSLGHAYLEGKGPNGEGLEAKPQHGLELLDSVAGQDDGLALALLGKAYLEGQGIPAQPQVARDYLERGHQTGHPYATAQLGLLYLGDQGMPAAPARAETLLQTAVDQGQTQAMRRLGEEYISGEILPQRPEQGVALLERAIDAGDTSAMTRLGNAYLEGKNLPAMPNKGVALLERAAEAGDTTAMTSLGEAYLTSDTLPRQPQRGVALLQRAVEAGDVGAMTRLGDAYLGGVPEVRGPEGRALLEQAAAQGDAYAMALLGRAYRQGRGVPQDLQLATQWLERSKQAGHETASRSLLLTLRDRGRAGDIDALTEAAKNGLASAQSDLGELQLANGQIDQGLSWLKKAADQGYTPARLDLAHAYLDGDIVTPDTAQGLKYLEQAVNAGDVNAYQLKGKVYLKGIGVQKDAGKAETWLRRASQAGDTSASALLGRALLRGDQGIPQDVSQGKRLLQHAAEQNDAGAQATLGREYLRGDILTFDPRMGADYLFRSANQGHPTARLALAEAYLRAKGLENANRNQALLWLDKTLEGNSQVALETLYQVLSESKVPQPDAEQGEAFQE
ncbi:tetratricopeptide repeat protein [Pistricoccus aurantiacus]|uniref:tetratricopeptide repeat protein n=1 Tax=Pistricoccus aurantiacus TaxID=1883414 RepID=UPI00363F1F39